MKMAMSAGTRNHYRMDQIRARHFMQTGEKAGLSPIFVDTAIEEVICKAETALAHIEDSLPADFPGKIHESVKAGFCSRLQILRIKN